MSGTDVILYFWDELEKIAQEQPSYVDRGLSAAPMVGASIGGLWGVTSPKAFNPSGLFPSLKGRSHSLRSRVVSGLLGAGLGATTAWLPSTFRDAYKAIVPPTPSPTQGNAYGYGSTQPHNSQIPIIAKRGSGIGE